MEYSEKHMGKRRVKEDSDPFSPFHQHSRAKSKQNPFMTVPWRRNGITLWPQLRRGSKLTVQKLSHSHSTHTQFYDCIA